jgi:hypothetical protein
MSDMCRNCGERRELRGELVMNAEIVEDVASTK